MTLLAMLYTHSFYGIKRLFDRLPIYRHFRPAMGAFLTGLFALVLYYAMHRNSQVLAVLAFGYSAIQDAVMNESNATAMILLAIAFGKIFTTGLTIGSGGSGGVFGPSMVIGGCAGGALGIFFHHLSPWLVPHPASFVIVGMAGFFAAAAKTPFSTLIMVSEMTGGYSLLLPSLWVCTLSYILSDKQSIYSSQVESRSLSPAHQGSYVRAGPGGGAGAASSCPSPQNVIGAPPDDPLQTVLERLRDAPYPVLPVVDGENRLVGVVDRGRGPFRLAGPVAVAADSGRRHDAQRRAAAHSRRHSRSGQGTIRGERSARPCRSSMISKRRQVIGMVRRFDIAAPICNGSTAPRRVESEEWRVEREE